MRIPFTKMVGTGNDFVIVDTRRRPLSVLRPRWPAVSRAICDRRQGIGADGLLVLEPSRRCDVRMRVFNPDGTEAHMCGNGARCVALYLQNGARRGNAARWPMSIETGAGPLSARVQGHRVAMRMTDPTTLRLDQAIALEGRRLRYGFVNTGVPHIVVRVESLDRVDVDRIGRALRRHRRFAPQGTNVNFIQPDAKRPMRVRVRTYERGVEAETLACGTGAVASAVVHAVQQRKARRAGQAGPCRVEVETRSGELLIVRCAVSLRGGRPQVAGVMLVGPAARIFDGNLVWPLRNNR